MAVEMDRLEIVINAQAAKATAQVAALTKQLDKLSKSLSHSSSKGLLSGLTALPSATLKAQTGLLKLGATATKTFLRFGNGSKQIQKATISLKNLLGVAAGFYGIRSLVTWGKDAIELSSNLTEVQNVVENAFGEKGTAAVEKFVETSRTEFGMAELLAKRVSSRFQAMGVSMGITGQQVAKANANISGSMADAYDKTTASMSAMSLNLTRLAADMASFYNVDQEESAEALNAVFTGMTRPLRRFGLDLTQATLQEWALKQGMDVDVQAMTQAEKTLLRYQYVMANTTMVQGDFARTSQTWANQVRILRQNFEVLGSTIGNILINTFRPLVIWLNNAMGAVISFAETIGNALGTIFGWQILHTPSGSVADYYDDMADATDSIGTAGNNAADGLDNANKSAKEFQETVLGFDKLNKLSAVPIATTPKSSGSGGGTPAGSGGVAPASGAGAQFSIVKKDSWLEDYKSEIDSLYKLGDYISQKLTEAMERINWDAAYEKARGFGTGLADFLNGLISPELFKAVGETVASSLNTALQLLNEFGTKFEWGEFGTSLSSGLVSYLTTFDWKLAAEDFNTLVNGIQTTIGAALDDFNSKDGFALVGNKVGTYVRDILTNHNWDLMADNFVSLANGIVKAASSAVTALGNEDGFAVIGKKAGHFVRKTLMHYDWRTTSKLFTDLANGIVRGARNAIEEVGRNNGFYVIGSKVSSFIKTTLGGIAWDTEVYPAADEFASGLATFLNGLFNEETFSSVGSTVASFLNTALHSLDTFGTTFEWDKFGISLAAGINSFFNTFNFEMLADAFNKWGLGILNSIQSMLVTVRWFEIGQKIGEFIKNINWDGWFAGIGNVIAVAINKVIEVAKGFVNATGLGDPLTKALDNIQEACTRFQEGVNWTELSEGVKELVDALAPAVSGFAIGLSEVFGALADIGVDVLNTIATVFKEIAKAIKSLPEGSVEKFGKGLGLAAGALITINGLNSVATIIKNVVSALGVLGSSGATAAKNVNDTATAMGEAGTEGQTAASGGIAAFFKQFLMNSGVTVTFQNAIKKHVIDTLNGANQKAEDARIAFGNVAWALRDAGIEGDFFGMKMVDVESPMSTIMGKTPDFATAFGEVSKRFEESGGNVETFKTRLSELTSEGAFSEAQAKVIQDYIEGIGTSATGADTDTGKFKTNLFGFAGQMFGQTLLVAAMGTTFKNLGTESDSATTLVDQLKGKVGEFADEVKSKKVEMNTNSVEFGGALPKGIATGINDNAEEAFNASMDISKGLLEKAREAAGFDGSDLITLVDFGEDIDSGLAKGISDNASLVEDAADELAATSLIAQIRDELDSNSPSKVMEDIGKDVVDGLSNGIGDNASDVTDAIGSLVDDMLDEISGQDALDSFRDAGESLADEVSSGMIVTDFSGVPDAWYTAMNFTDLNSNLYSAGQSAAKNFADGMKTLDMPTISYYRASWDYHDDDSDGSWDTATPVYKSYWHYAKGGFPNRGEMFIANESGPEMIGRMGHKNVVANNMQITEGIKAAVVDGMMEVAMATSSRDDSVPYVINMRVVTDDDETLARRVEKGRMKRDSRYSPTPSFA